MSTKVRKRDRRKGTPAAFLARGRNVGSRELVACLGDSITAGGASFDWVADLRTRLPTGSFEVVNGGVDGDLAWNVVQRLDDAIRCEPNVVILLIGTNDVAATYSATKAWGYRLQKRLDRAPTLGSYVENVSTILRRLTTETTARIAVLEIPMLGEDLQSTMNQRVDTYNEALREVAAAYGATCLPLHDQLAALVPSGHRPRYAGKVGPILRAVANHHVRRLSWDTAGERNGLAVLTDHVHLGERGGRVVVDLVSGYLGVATTTTTGDLVGSVDRDEANGLPEESRRTKADGAMRTAPETDSGLPQDGRGRT